MRIPHLKKALGLGAAVLVLTASSAFAAPAVANGSVNVRSGPGTSYRVLDQLRPGERVNIDRRAGGWCHIVKSGPDGWVSCAYLNGRTAVRRYYPYYNSAPDLSFSFGFGYPMGHHWWNNNNHHHHHH